MKATKKQLALKEIAEVMSKHEFIEEILKEKCGVFRTLNDCPDHQGLTRHTYCKPTYKYCYDCWDTALSWADIYFKEE